ncbi:myelin-oligodendrocyte glycoprotein-like isoform 2-T2 [Anableps anableps]
MKGHYQVRGSSQPIVAAPGDDVILQCHVEPEFDVVDVTVEWSKPDPKPRPKGMEYVHLYRDNREVLDMKTLSYHGRTTLLPDDLKKGNISLMITNVTTADEGQYKCFIPKLNGQIKYSIVHLIIDKSSSKKVTTETPLYPETTRHNDLNGGVSYSSRLTLLMVVWVLLIFCT